MEGEQRICSGHCWRIEIVGWMFVNILRLPARQGLPTLDPEGDMRVEDSLYRKQVRKVRPTAGSCGCDDRGLLWIERHDFCSGRSTCRLIVGWGALLCAG